MLWRLQLKYFTHLAIPTMFTISMISFAIVWSQTNYLWKNWTNLAGKPMVFRWSCHACIVFDTSCTCILFGFYWKFTEFLSYLVALININCFAMSVFENLYIAWTRKKYFINYHLLMIWTQMSFLLSFNGMPVGYLKIKSWNIFWQKVMYFIHSCVIILCLWFNLADKSDFSMYPL